MLDSVPHVLTPKPVASYFVWRRHLAHFTASAASAAGRALGIVVLSAFLYLYRQFALALVSRLGTTRRKIDVPKFLLQFIVLVWCR